MNQRSDPNREFRHVEATHLLQAPPPPGFDVLAEEPDAATREALVDHALAARAQALAAAETARAPGGRAWFRGRPIVASVLAVAAAVLLIVSLRPTRSAGRFELEMRGGHGELRGTASEANVEAVLSLRNAPTWVVHLAEPDPTQRLALYMVAEDASGTLTLLVPTVERSDVAFRADGELGTLGVLPGAVTLHFVVGPRNDADGAVAAVRAVRGGTRTSTEWQIKSQAFRISE